MLDFVLSTNVDRLTEVAAEQLGEPQAYVAVDAAEANIPRAHSGHIKLHGCLHRDEANTLWCRTQLSSEPIKTRVAELQAWVSTHLKARDVVFLGFWSDWAYLNDIFQSALTPTENALVLIVNPSDDCELEEKARGLWTWSCQPGITRRIVRQSAADFLTELRKLMWTNFLNRVLRQSERAFVELGGSPGAAKYSIAPGALSADEAYRLKLDVCGVPYAQVSRQKRPDEHMQRLGIIHLELLSLGARLEGNSFVLSDKRIRVVNGEGQLLSHVKGRYAGEPAQFSPADLTICTGAIDDNMPESVVRGDSPLATIVRTSGGATWRTEASASSLWRRDRNAATPGG